MQSNLTHGWWTRLHDVLPIIFSHLDPASLCVAATVCWQWRNVAESPDTWERLYRRLAPVRPALFGCVLVSEYCVVLRIVLLHTFVVSLHACVPPSMYLFVVALRHHVQASAISSTARKHTNRHRPNWRAITRARGIMQEAQRTVSEVQAQLNLGLLDGTDGSIRLPDAASAYAAMGACPDEPVVLNVPEVAVSC